MSQELFFEIGTEELPPKFITKACDHLKNTFLAQMAEKGLDITGWQALALGTPRRLALVVSGMPEKQEDTVEELIGPPAKVAFDENGALTKAALGFCKSKGAKAETAYKAVTPKGEYLAIKIERKGQKIADLIGPALHETLHTMPAPKMMRWGDGVHQFVRPVHRLVAIFNGNVIPLEFQGITSGSESSGHRLMAPGSFKVNSFKDYITATLEHSVIPYRERQDVAAILPNVTLPDGRKEIIKASLLKLAESLGAEIYGMKKGDDPLLRDHYYTTLLDEVSQMTEFPKVVLGSFSADFLRLPKEVILSELRDNQRCFAFIGNDGRLLPNFAAVADNGAAEEETIRRGNQRVIRARLSDAAYFFDLDLKTPLKELVPALKGIIFQRQLGTVYERSERVAKLAIAIGAEMDFCHPLAAGEEVANFINDVALNSTEAKLRLKCQVGRAALLAKADLVTKMVGEFPELQGIMGREYAGHNGETPDIALAIADHYRPRFAGDPLPAGRVGELVAIADKLDLVCGIIGIGKKPSGSADPFALRRAASGILRILVEKGLFLNIKDLIKKSIVLLDGKLTRPAAEVEADVLSFFMDRFKNAKFVEGLATEAVNAVIMADFTMPFDAYCRLKALNEIYGEADFAPVVTTFRRVYNIIQDSVPTGEVDSALFKHDSENSLMLATKAMAKQISSRLTTITSVAYRQVFADMATLKKDVDNFFDNVMVNAEDPAVKENRRRLLRDVAAIFGKIANFSELHA